MAAISILAYGRTRTTKTSQARFIIEYVWEKFGKKTRFITTDTGSLWAPIQDLVDAGIAVPLFMPTEPAYNPQSVMRKLRRGEWPKNGEIKKSRKVEVKDATGKVTKIEWKTQNEWLEWDAQSDSAEIGAYVFESLTSFSTGLMRDLAEKGVTLGTGLTPGLRTEDGEAFGNNTMQHYGMGHTEILGLLDAVVTLPIEIVYLTALEGVGEDDDGPAKRAVLGPKVMGKAITEIVPSRVNDCLHFVDAVEGEKRTVRCYIRPHADAQIAKMIWPAGLRNLNTPAVLAAIEKKWPLGYFTLTPEKGIRELLEFKDEMAELAAAQIKSLLARKGAVDETK